MLSVFLFVVVFAFICGFVAGRDDVNARGASELIDIEEVADVNVCCDCSDDSDSDNWSELWVEENAEWLSELDAYFHADESSVPTLEDHIVYIMPNAIELLTEEFNNLPHRVMPNRYGWNVG